MLAVVVFVFIFVNRLVSGMRINMHYNKYIDDATDVRAVVTNVTEERDSEDTYYHVDARYEYKGEVYEEYAGRFNKVYKSGDSIDLKILVDSPNVIFDDDSGVFYIFLAVVAYCMMVALLYFVIHIIRKERKKEITNKQIYGATKAFNIMMAAMIFATLAFFRVMQMYFYPHLIVTDIDKWISGIIFTLAALFWIILIIKVNIYSVSKYTLTTDVCLDKRREEEGDSTVYRTFFNCGKTRNPDIYKNVNVGKSCYVLTNPRGKILAAYDTEEWGSPSFSVNDFDYKREYTKDFIFTLLYSVAASLVLIGFITLVGRLFV